MHALKAILIGLTDELNQATESELRSHGAAVDRQYPNLTTALAEMQLASSNKWILVVLLKRRDELETVRRLCDNFPDHPVLALSTLATDDGIALEAMRAGVNQLVPLPLAPGELRHAIERVARQFGLQGCAGTVIAVTGVTEGCGATSVAVNLANEIAVGTGRSVVLAETGLRMGRLAVILDVKPRHTTEDLLANIELMDLESVQRALTTFRERFHVLPGPYQTLMPNAVSLADLQRLIGVLRRVADVVVVDMPYTFDDAYFGVLASADHLVLVAEQKVPSVHTMLILREALHARGITGTQHLVVNRYAADLPGATLNEIKKVLKADRLLTIRSDGMGMLTALNNGQPLREAAAQSPALADFDALASDILNETPIVPARHRAADAVHQFMHLIGCE